MKGTLVAVAWLVLPALFAPAAISAGEGAEMREAGAYVVHYNAFHASRLDSMLARRYGLPQSADRYVLTVAITERDSGEQVAASVMAQVTRPDGRMHQFEMREIRDGTDIYYVGEMALKSADELDFVLRVQPDEDMPPESIRFSRRLSTD